MLQLRLALLQKLVENLYEDYQIQNQPLQVRAVYLMEEVGEVAKEIRLIANSSPEASREEELADELMDVIVVCLGIANHAGLNMERAWFENYNKHRDRINAGKVGDQWTL